MERTIEVIGRAFWRFKARTARRCRASVTGVFTSVRWVPLAKVFAFQHYSSSLGRRTCGVLYWLGEPGRRSARLALPGSDPEYRLPALDAYVRGLRPQAPR